MWRETPTGFGTFGSDQNSQTYFQFSTDCRTRYLAVLQYIDNACTPLDILRRFIVPHLHSMKHIFEGRAECELPSLCAFLLEVEQHGWSYRHIAMVGMSIHRRHDSLFWTGVRKLLL